jgi:putative Holliday junction resolvase
MKILGLDFGTRRIGVAVSDGLLITAQGRGPVSAEDTARAIAAIRNIIKEEGVGEVVVGLPLNMNGTHSEKTEETLRFIEGLSRAVDIPVRTWDERLTSVQAERILLEGDVSRAGRRKRSDRIAAQLILQSYLDSRKRDTGPERGNDAS